MTILQNPELLKTQSYINGKWINANDGKKFSVFNPYDGKLLAEVADLGVEETRYAIESAHKAWQTWRKMTAKERGKILMRWAALIRQNISHHVLLLTLEQGKTLEQAKMDMEHVITLLEWYVAESLRVHGQTVTPPNQDTRLMTIKQPIGVVAAITPWNFPCSIFMQKCAPALAAGCTIVIKPAEDTPLTTLALAQLAEDAGIPAGVLNIITCKQPDAVGKELSTNPLVRLLSFTGSTVTGKLLAQQAANTVKKVCLELGGNCPFIIFADANIDHAVDQAIFLKFFNAGQICCGINRILVEDAIYADVVARFVEKAKHLKLGSGLDAATQISPVVNEKGIQKIQRLVDEAQTKGAVLKLGGKCVAGNKLLYEPTVLSEVTRDAAIFREEIFGPVAAFYRFKTEDEAIHMANDTPHGLAAYFFTQNLDRVQRVSEALEAGSVGANSTAIFSETVPFGGFKESGLGREGGVVGSLDDYYETKTIALGRVNVPSL